MFQVPDVVLVGYGRQQVYQNKCLKCGKLFFERDSGKEMERELFCDECALGYSKECLEKYIQPSNLASYSYVGNVVGWVVKTSISMKRSRYNYNKIYKRDQYTCQYCGYSPRKHDEFFPLHIDHVNPYAHGGSNRMVNLVVACSQCNHLVSAKVFTNFEAKRKFIIKEKVKRKLFYDKKFVTIQGLEELLA